MLNSIINKLWYTKHPLRWFLFPFALLYRGIMKCRYVYLTQFRQTTFSTPVIVVGNLSVGGTGKTPFVIALAKHLTAAGWRVGIVSRGYGALARDYPRAVSLQDAPADVGDEPYLIAKKTQCPVVIDPNRVKAVDYLLTHFGCTIVISDDGLQHYALGRAIEIVMVDGFRGLGNGLCLPAGPLREPPSRMAHADFKIMNEGQGPGFYSMTCVPGTPIPLQPNAQSLSDLNPSSVAAVAGIGNPQRFFATLSALNIQFTPYAFADHHRFRADDLQLQEEVILMTEKDAVKCQTFATASMYYVPIEAQVSPEFWQALDSQLQGFKS